MKLLQFCNLDTRSQAAQTVKYFTSLPFRPGLICVQSRPPARHLHIKGGKGASHLARTHFRSIKSCGEPACTYMSASEDGIGGDAV